MIFIGKGVTVEPNVVLDASNGSIYLDDYSKVMANTVIKGPVYLGKNSIVKVSAKIYEGTSVGKVCKVGGEIEETIFQGYSNKQHDGFIGHSYIGEWVNLGADTNNSDLKNNYKTVKVYFYPEEKYIDKNLQFFGMIIGDHSKSGINTIAKATPGRLSARIWCTWTGVPLFGETRSGSTVRRETLSRYTVRSGCGPP